MREPCAFFLYKWHVCNTQHRKLLGGVLCLLRTFCLSQPCCGIEEVHNGLHSWADADLSLKHFISEVFCYCFSSPFRQLCVCFLHRNCRVRCNDCLFFKYFMTNFRLLVSMFNLFATLLSFTWVPRTFTQGKKLLFLDVCFQMQQLKWVASWQFSIISQILPLTYCIIWQIICQTTFHPSCHTWCYAEVRYDCLFCCNKFSVHSRHWYFLVQPQ